MIEPLLFALSGFLVAALIGLVIFLLYRRLQHKKKSKIAPDTSKIVAATMATKEIDNLEQEINHLRSCLHLEKSNFEKSQNALKAAREANREQAKKLDALTDKTHRLLTDMASLKIDLASKDAEAENLRSILNIVRNQGRKTMPPHISLKNDSVTGHTETRRAETGRAQTGRAETGRAQTEHTETRRADNLLMTKNNFIAKRDISLADLADKTKRLRIRHDALVSALKQQAIFNQDQKRRDELTEIAAMMINLTQAKEGQNSPIHDILGKYKPIKTGNIVKTNLAERAIRHIEGAAIEGATK